MARKFTWRQRMRYRFDNFMAGGTRAQLLALLWFSIALAVVFTALLFGLNSGPGADQKGLLETLWTTSMGVLRSGTPGWTPDHIVYMFVKGGLFVASLLVGSMLIGIITSGFRTMVGDLAKGRSPVPVSGHTVILGWSSIVADTVRELLIAKQSEAEGHIVVMAPKDKTTMDGELLGKIGDPGTTVVATRKGSPFSASDLDLVNVDEARAIILLPPEDHANPDIEVIKALMALVGKPTIRTEPWQIVTSLRDPKNVQTARLACREEARLLRSRIFVSKITAQACRQSGLPIVYTELLSFHGHEIYTVREPRLAGKTFAEAVRAYDTAAVFGILDAEGAALLNPAPDRVVGKDEKLVLLAEDDSAIRMDGKAHAVVEELVVARPTPKPDAERTLVLDWNDGGRTILIELDQFVVEGSACTVLVPDEARAEEVRAVAAELKRQSVEVRVAEPTAWESLEGLDLTSFDHVILLSSDKLPPAEADARVLVGLIHVRHLLDKSEEKHSVGIVSELVMAENRAIAQTDRADDFVVGNHLVSLIYSQLAENPDVAAILGGLLSDEGAEIYLKPVEDYVKLGEEVDGYTLLDAAQKKGEVAIGYRVLAEHADTKANYGVHLNPRKSAKVRFAAGDRVIVIAEDYFE